MVFCQFPSKTGGSFPWRGSSFHPIGFGFCGNLGKGPGGGAGGGGPPYGFWFCFGFSVVVLNWFLVGRDHASLRLTEGVVLDDVADCDCSGAAMVQILIRIWS